MAAQGSVLEEAHLLETYRQCQMLPTISSVECVAVRASTPRRLTSHGPTDHARHCLLCLLRGIRPDHSRRLPLLHGSHVLPQETLQVGGDINTTSICSCCSVDPEHPPFNSVT